MSLFQLSEVEERAAMKQLFAYTYFRALGTRGSIVHLCDSTWEHACRFLWFFDPEGQTDEGYSPKKALSEIQDEIDNTDLASLPCMEAFLDVALHMNNHFHGIGAKTLNDPMVFDPALQSTLKGLDLIDANGTPAKPLIIDAIDRWHFFEDGSRGHQPEVKIYLERIAGEAWMSASADDRNYILNELEIGSKSSIHGLENWFTSRWRFGVWLNAGEWEKDSNLFGSHPAMGWLMITYIQKGLHEGRIRPR